MAIQMVFFGVIVCIGIIECKIKTVTLEIKNGSVEKDNDNPLHCDGFNRILLKTYTYKPKNKDESDIVNPELLFAACSWKENCSLSQALVKKITGNTNQGFLYIKHGCPAVNSAKSPCNTTVVNRVKTLNLIFDASRSHQQSNINYEGWETFLQSNTCSCKVTGIFKLKVRDIRLHAFKNGSCPSVTVNASSTCSSCSTVKSNCTHRFSLNTLVSNETDEQTGHIFLTGLSSLYSPSLIWVQVLKNGNNEYNVSCSSNISVVSTTSASISTVSTSQLTTSTVTKSTSSSSAGTGTRKSSSYGTTVLSGTADSGRLKDDTQDDSTSPASVVVPVVVGSVVIITVVLVIIYCRKKQNFGGTRISNPAYEVTKDDNNMLSKVLKDRANSLDDGDPAEIEEDHYIDVADDDHEVKGDIDNEYNKILFKNTPVPVDESYSHINQIKSIEHEDYDHIKGMTVIDSQTYSNGHPPGIQCTDNDTIHDTDADQDSVMQTSEDSSMTYDHLGQTGKRHAPITDDQDTYYSHVPSKFNGSAGRGKPNHNGTTSNNVSSVAEPMNEDNGMEHDYFVLEPNADNQ